MMKVLVVVTMTTTKMELGAPLQMMRVFSEANAKNMPWSSKRLGVA
jgi:hypothetical protein